MGIVKERLENYKEKGSRSQSGVGRVSLMALLLSKCATQELRLAFVRGVEEGWTRSGARSSAVVLMVLRRSAASIV